MLKSSKKAKNNSCKSVKAGGLRGGKVVHRHSSSAQMTERARAENILLKRYGDLTPRELRAVSAVSTALRNSPCAREGGSEKHEAVCVRERETK